jgi:hypothetical protein
MEDWKKVFFRKFSKYARLKPNMCLENSRRENFFWKLLCARKWIFLEMDLPGKIHLSPGKINRWCDFDQTSF